MKVNNVYVGNNLDILKTFPDNSIDSVVTDPPYGLGKEPNAIEVLQSWITNGYHEVKGKGFMGKEWDAFVPQPNFWKEIYRVLKPGGYVLSFAGTRTYDWMVMAVRLAGFEIRDMIAWLYGSGFPKSMDISKAIDKSMGAKREVVGSYKVGGNAAQSTKEKGGTYASNTNSIGVKPIDINITAPSTEEAKQWQGWGSSLKPALEPIVMARKPLDGTVAQNVLKHGVGGINIDECRVEAEPELAKNWNRNQSQSAKNGGVAMNKGLDTIDLREYTPTGRFPANVIHDGSDEVVELFPDSEGGHFPSNNKNGNSIFGTNNLEQKEKFMNDGGSASRFFYTAKASQEERNFGLYDFTKKGGGFDGMKVNDGRKTAIDNPYQRGETVRKNIHPT